MAIHITNATTPWCALSGKAASEVIDFPVAFKGDKVSCPIQGHGPTTIVEGNPDYLDNGIPVAFHGHKCGCGCALISSFSAAKVG